MDKYEVTLSFRTEVEAKSEEEAVRIAEKAANENGFEVSCVNISHFN
jgi:2'-5' RNA ligase